jgi:hypothetical protein
LKKVVFLGVEYCCLFRWLKVLIEEKCFPLHYSGRAQKNLTTEAQLKLQMPCSGVNRNCVGLPSLLPNALQQIHRNPQQLAAMPPLRKTQFHLKAFDVEESAEYSSGRSPFRPVSASLE